MTQTFPLFFSFLFQFIYLFHGLAAAALAAARRLAACVTWDNKNSPVRNCCCYTVKNRNEPFDEKERKRTGNNLWSFWRRRSCLPPSHDDVRWYKHFRGKVSSWYRFAFISILLERCILFFFNFITKRISEDRYFIGKRDTYGRCSYLPFEFSFNCEKLCRVSFFKTRLNEQLMLNSNKNILLPSKPRYFLPRKEI